MRMLAVALSLVASLGVAAADTAPTIPAEAIPAVKCLHDLFKSSPAVLSADLYVIEPIRSAVEFRFKGKNGSVITADLMLLTLRGVTYDVTIPPNEPDPGGEPLDFLAPFNLSSKCGVTPGLDDLTPGPKPRPEWRQIDWSSLLPVQSPSPTPPT